jgi:fucose permease
VDHDAVVFLRRVTRGKNRRAIGITIYAGNHIRERRTDARGLSWIIPGSLLAGFGLASIFPISVSLFPRWFRESSRSASGAVFASGNMGGAVLPWLVGVISTHFGSLRLGFFVPLAAVTIMLAFYIAQEITGRHLRAATAQLTTPS